ncbi:MAG: DUF1937 family protein [Methanoregulaceae archaeon]
MILPTVLYIAGPFSHEDPIHGIPENILAASKVALECVRRGFSVHCPHKNYAGFQHVEDVPWEFWCIADFAILERCDAVLFLEGWANSEGASREMQFAHEKGIPVFFVRDGIPDPGTVGRRYDGSK